MAIIATYFRNNKLSNFFAFLSHSKYRFFPHSTFLRKYWFVELFSFRSFYSMPKYNNTDLDIQRVSQLFVFQKHENLLIMLIELCCLCIIFIHHIWILLEPPTLMFVTWAKLFFLKLLARSSARLWFL